MRTTVQDRGSHTFVAIVDSTDASADISDTGSETRVLFHVAAGHIPMHVRAQLVDAVFEQPQLRPRRRLHASVPIGDAQLIDLVQRRCVSVQMRAAGATCLIDAETV